MNRLIPLFLLLNTVLGSTKTNEFTIFSILKPLSLMKETEKQIQLNSIWSWSQLVPLENIILYVDENESCSFLLDLYPQIKCRKFPPSKCFHKTYQRSYVACAFQLAQKQAKTPTLLFVNGDILLDDSISHAITHVSKHLSRFFMVGCRRDYDMSDGIDISNPEAVMLDARSKSRLHSTTGIDIIAFKTDAIIRMPPFLVGVYRWDNWLLSEILLRTNITMIDVTQSVTAIHQQVKIPDHVTPPPHSSRVGAQYNDALTKNASGLDYKIGFIHNAHQVLIGDCKENNCLLKNNLNQSEQVLLMRRANPDKYIAVLTVNTGYMMMAWNWICWAKRIGFRNYILLAEDLQVYELLQSAGEPVFISHNQSLVTSSKTESKYGSFEFQITMAYRVQFLMNVLRAGFHFLTADMDAIWLADPFDHVSHNLSITIQGQTHKETKMSGGFILVHATSEGRKFWQNVIDCQQENLFILQQGTRIRGKRPLSDFTEQECINNRLNTTIINLLDRYLFPDGRSFFDLQQPQRRGIVPVVIHGNWLVGLEAKLARLEAWGLLSTSNQYCSLLQAGIPFRKSEQEPAFKLRIRVLTYNRLQSLQRLLLSLVQANYSGDSVPLDIYVDRPVPDAPDSESNEWKALISYLKPSSQKESEFQWPHGPLSIVIHDQHIGLLGQWTKSSNHSEVQLFLEDDLVVSKDYYAFIKRMIEFYYFNETNYDAQVFGLSLQHQHTVLGQATGQKTIDIEKELNQWGSPAFFKYQLLGSWGTIFFPKHWQKFLEWMESVNMKNVEAACTPNLLLVQWWLERHHTGRMWTPWFIRFAFEQGWYSLYTNFPEREAFAVSYREAGLNFNVTRGPMNPLIEKIDPLLHLKFNRTLPIFDFHFKEVSNPPMLSIRSNLWHQKHFFNQCHIVEKESKEKTLAKMQPISLKMTAHESNNDGLPTSSTTLGGLMSKDVVSRESSTISRNCFKLFLLFEIVSVVPIVSIVIVLTLFLTRRRNGRRKILRR